MVDRIFFQTFGATLSALSSPTKLLTWFRGRGVCSLAAAYQASFHCRESLSISLYNGVYQSPVPVRLKAQTCLSPCINMVRRRWPGGGWTIK
jgi:hypothetical protein